jgi:hypothetical protein
LKNDLYIFLCRAKPNEKELLGKKMKSTKKERERETGSWEGEKDMEE